MYLFDFCGVPKNAQEDQTPDEFYRGLVREVVRAIEEGEKLSETTPKSLSAMTNLYLPQILRDFPEFNWEEMQRMVEQAVREYLGQFPDIRIHRTVISGYRKHGETVP